MLHKLFILFLSIFLSGCIHQDVRIVLRADGSGEYHIKKATTQIESAIIANVPSELRDMALAEQKGIEEKYPGGLKKISYSVLPNPDDPSQYVELSVYSFPHLGEVLPVLENIIDMGPRYAYRDGKFVIFLDREKQEFDGMQADEMMKNAYLNLTIELPATPISSNGEAQGNVVSWKFNADDLKKFQKMKMGENLFKVSIPASAIKVDLTPRLVVEKEKKTLSEDQKKDFEPLNYFEARFPIIGDKAESPAKASLNVQFPVNDFQLPLVYKDLQITSFVVKGKEVATELKSKTEGVFNGNDPWGRKTDGFLIQLEFPFTDPWISKIDKLRLEMKVDTVKDSKKILYPIEPQQSSVLIFPDPPNSSLDKVVLREIPLGSALSMYPMPSITLLTKIKPNNIAAFYIETDYGLKYKANSVESSLKQSDDYWDQEFKKFSKDIFMEEKFYEYKVGFENLPNAPFNLILETVMTQNFETKILVLEDIDVSP